MDAPSLTRLAVRVLPHRQVSSPTRVMAVRDARVAVIGMGYVGLSLAVEFGLQRATLGFDIEAGRIAALEQRLDTNHEVGADRLATATQLRFSAVPTDMAQCNTFIVAVPTPIDSDRKPDLGSLLAASRMVGKMLKRNDVVIYESTVFPGATEEWCVPELQACSGLTFNHDFHVGYSPERLVPGDPGRPLASIIKVTAGSTPEAADFVDALYRTIVTAGTYKAPTIRVAEAAKVIENIQRDVNIALINELSVIFSYLGIDTSQVLDAAATKWNFNRLQPGLVGGHCIGVDPYYLIHRSIEAGHEPRLIQAARAVNDGMSRHAARLLLDKLAARKVAASEARILVLGVTFKENCPDMRNSKAFDLVQTLQQAGALMEFADPWADAVAARSLLGTTMLSALPPAGPRYDAVILATAHCEYVALGAAVIRGWLKPSGVFFDLKGVFGFAESHLRL